MDFACRSLLPNIATASAEQKSRAATALFEIIAQTDSDVARMSFLGEVAQSLRVPLGALEKDWRAFLARRGSGRFANPNALPPPDTKPPAEATHSATEAHLLFLCLHHESLLRALANQLPQEWIDQSHAAGILLNRLLAEVAHNDWVGNSQIDQILETEEEKSLVATLLFESSDDDDLVKKASEGLRSLQRRFLEPRLRQIELEIATKGTDIDFSFLLKQRSDLRRQLLNPPKLTLGS